MGKKMKKKAPNPRKAQNRISTESPKSVLEGSGGDGDGDMKACNHYTKSTYELNQILVKIRSSSMDFVACEHCREEPVNMRGGKEKGKQPKKKGAGTRAAEAKSEQNFLWVCLDCGRYFCGGGVSILEPYGHARRHAKQDHHSWAVRAEDPLISWCYSCSSSVLIVMPDEVIKEGNESDKSRSLRDIAFEPMDSEKLKGYKVRGLLNLGNTCFFNSVMQNLFAMDLLRETLLGLDRPVGPLSVALRMLFTETSRGADSKGVINPKALFGCICAKAPQFKGYQQQDSHELLRYLLDGLHVEETNARKTSEVADDEEKINTKTKATLVDSIFSGQLSSTISCMECRHTSVVNEPFLDLSLPVPSKKHPSKKVPPPPPKRVNQRDKKKSRQPRESSVTQVSTMSVNQNAESSEQTSECIESGIAVPPPTHDNASEAQDFTWMDYLAGESSNCNYFSAHELEASIENGSCSKQEEAVSNEQSVSEFHDETETIVQSLSDLHTASCSNDLTVSLDTSVRGSCKDEVPHSCAPDTGIILLPCKEQDQDLADLDINDRTSLSQDPENINLIDVSVSESCAANSSCKQAEEEFDGFGDLFNEPEDTSHLNVERNAGEDMDITSWSGNISESNMEEVDDTDVPVSINSCLALFTKPELLSDEQAWYCERCSENSQGNRELGTNKLQAAEVSDLSVTLKSMADKDELISKKVVSNFVRYSANVNGLDNGKLVSSPKNEAILVEERFDQCEEMSNSQKQINIEGSQNSGEISSNNTLHLTETTPFSNVACCPDVLDKDMSGSETSQYFPTSSICVISHAQYSLGNPESNLHDINDRSNFENDGKKPKVASHSLQSHSNILLHKSSIDRSQEVIRVRKKGLKSGKVHPAKEKGERINMIKRDATKRILIDRVPPILTIHLKRFSQDARGRLTKLGGHVNFQETLDLRPYMDPRCINDRTSYRLIGVVEHSGSISGGHYVAYVRGDGRGSRSSTGQTWFYASDAYVREVSLAVVLNSEAYILFYERM